MELTYPINFIGLEEGATTGDVLTHHGEYLGKWTFTENEDQNSGGYHFFEDAQTEALFSEDIGVASSGLHRGMALSEICRAIREWHDEKQEQ